MKLLSFWTFLCMCIFESHVLSQGIDFYGGSWESARQLAQDEGKLIFVDAYAVWCGPCKRMSATVFKDEEVGKYMNANFINLKIDMEKEMGLSFGRDYPVRAYPTLLFIEPGGEIVHKAVGGLGTEDFLKLAQMVVRSYDRSGDYEEEYNAGSRDYDLVLAYIIALKTAGKSNTKIANDYLRMNPAISSKQRAEFIFESLNSVDSRVYELFIQNRELIEEIKGKEATEKRLTEACWKTLTTAIEFSSPELLDEAKAKAGIVLGASTDFVFRADYEYAKALIDTKLLTSSAWKLADKIYKNDSDQLMELCTELRAFSSVDPTVNNTAEKIAALVVDKDKSSEALLLYARILAQNHDYKKAMKQAQKAKNAARKEGKDTREIEEFISNLDAQ